MLRKKIESYTDKRCDHPNDYARGGVCVYHKENLPLKFMPELTSLALRVDRRRGDISFRHTYSQFTYKISKEIT